jgi:prepilin signal peptidase PulO-like enzyme (type II secretory pathway)
MFSAFFINDLTVAQRIFGSLFCLLPFLTANILSGNKLGMGDVKLVTAFGFVIGAYGGLTAAITGLCLMLLTVGLFQKIKKRNYSKKAVPLAPFLCSGFALCLLLF